MNETDNGIDVTIWTAAETARILQGESLNYQVQQQLQGRSTLANG